VLLVCLVALAKVAVAGPLEDAKEADRRGDYATELRLLQPLAGAGNAEARFLLGVMYRFGRGVPQNYTEAVKWYRLAAEQGNAWAQLGLGGMYDDGKGVRQDYREAVKWYGLAAAQGNVAAQSNLGAMYVGGEGVPRNYTEAAKWYRLAAAQGFSPAQNALGWMYKDGRGVPQNYKEAVKWLGLAAGQGEAHAQFGLAVMYEIGQGVPQSYVEAYKWATLAVANIANPQLSRSYAAGRDALAARMTAAQIAEAQALASAWKPAGPTQEAETTPAAPQQAAPTAQIVSGSGFFVAGNGEVLTNAHVVEGCFWADVAAPGIAASAPITARDAQADLALLKVPQRSPAIASLRLTARQGENIYVYGFPLTGLLSSGGNFTAGTVTALSGLHDDSRSLQISAPVQPGNSGGPLLDETGNVVGVVVAKLDALRLARATDDIPRERPALC
jgi:TPR repeat protein